MGSNSVNFFTIIVIVVIILLVYYRRPSNKIENFEGLPNKGISGFGMTEPIPDYPLFVNFYP
jgi:hypothetical protein